MARFDKEPSALQKKPVRGPARFIVLTLQKWIWGLSHHWLFLANLLAGLILGLGFLAPALLALDMTAPGQAVYRFLAPHNHQLPQRSYFLFGPSPGVHSYTEAQLLAWGADPRQLEAFVGASEIGFKTALNHRMVAIFSAIFLGGLAWAWAGRQPRLDAVLFLLFFLPLMVDGLSHVYSEQNGSGFRESNLWAAILTAQSLPATFYQGHTIGSLNWWLRTLTGGLFGLGLVWFLYPWLDDRFDAVRQQLEPKLKRVGAIKG